MKLKYSPEEEAEPKTDFIFGGSFDIEEAEIQNGGLDHRGALSVQAEEQDNFPGSAPAGLVPEI